MIAFNVVLLDWVDSDVEALGFEGTKSKFSFFEGSWAPPN